MNHGSSSLIGNKAAVAGTFIAFFALVAILFILCNKKTLTTSESHVSSPARFVPFGDVHAATDGFHPSRVIGTGPLRTVYNAVSGTSDLFAVKRIHPNLVLSNACGLGFAARMRFLSLAEHPNVVSVLGYSEAPAERVIVTELVPTMRSLDWYLQSSMEILDWHQRLRIIADTARGIKHLHDGAATGIVHGRVRSANVMVDAGFCGRVCDYGISFLYGGDCKGGFEEGKARDVFGFGVVLLEVLSGRRWDKGAIVAWALPLIRGCRVGEVLDSRLGPPINVRPLERMAKVASACVGNGGRSRPTMAQVAAILSDLELQPCGSC